MIVFWSSRRHQLVVAHRPEHPPPVTAGPGTPRIPAAGRDNAGRFAKGVTGNPDGRPEGLASYIREKTHNGEDLADFILKVFNGENGFGSEVTGNDSGR